MREAEGAVVFDDIVPLVPVQVIDIDVRPDTTQTSDSFVERKKKTCIYLFVKRDF